MLLFSQKSKNIADFFKSELKRATVEFNLHFPEENDVSRRPIRLSDVNIDNIRREIIKKSPTKKISAEVMEIEDESQLSDVKNMTNRQFFNNL